MENAALEVREYDPSRDGSAVRARFIELQDFERSLDPRMPAGAEIAIRADGHMMAVKGRLPESGGEA